MKNPKTRYTRICLIVIYTKPISDGGHTKFTHCVLDINFPNFYSPLMHLFTLYQNQNFEPEIKY